MRSNFDVTVALNTHMCKMH